MLVTIKNVEKLLSWDSSNTKIVDLSFLTVQDSASDIFRVFIFETDLENNRTYKMGSFLRTSGDYETQKYRFQRSWKISSRSLLWMNHHKLDEALIHTYTNPSRGRFIPTELHEYQLPDEMRITKNRVLNPLYKKHIQEECTWGFEYAYLRSLDHYVPNDSDYYNALAKVTDLDYGESFNLNDVRDLLELDPLFEVEEVIEY